ncbi:MAG: flagellar hook-associated protein FlgL [Deltaproteobacteria bacterium]|nr:flagellar hook-associated protein FlgL [Deltaproteobacteria bacterium]
MRVSDNMRYYSTIKNMNSLQEGYNALLEKLASQKKINRPSDDPTGMMKVLNGRQTLASLDQYRGNIEQGTAWIRMTDTALSGILDLLSIIGSAVDHYDMEDMATQQIYAGQVRDTRDQILSLANSQLNGNHLFAGSLVGTEPFSAAPHEAGVESGMGARNAYTGTLVPDGVYMGASNKTYVVRMTEGGTVGTASYRISQDGGKTWGAPSDAWSGGDTILLPDDLTLTFDAGDVGENDVFYVKAYAEGYYKGDDQSLSLPIGAGNLAAYSTPGSEAFAGLFETLTALITAMEGYDAAEVEAQRANVAAARERIELAASLCSTKQLRLEMAENSLSRLDKQVTDIVANAENADVTALGMLLSMKEIALKSTYALAGGLGQNSILNFLK